jgi:hypothetical protein
VVAGHIDPLVKHQEGGPVVAGGQRQGELMDRFSPFGGRTEGLAEGHVFRLP